MARFVYKAVAPTGDVVEGEMEAANRMAVVERLRSQGHVPIRADEHSAAQRSSFWQLSLTGQRVRPRDISHLTRELATLLHAGLTLDRALTILTELAGTQALKDTVRRVQERLRQGKTLAESLDGEPFPEYYVGMVRAGEAGGTLDEVLARLSETLERNLALRESVKSALQYPILVLIMAGISVIILLTAVIPEFAPLFADSDVALPLSTRVVVAMSDLFRSYWWAVILVSLLLFLLIRRQTKDPAGRRRWDYRVLRLPLAGDLVRKIEVARFARTLGTLLANGVSVLGALSMTTDTMRNRAIAGAIEDVRTRLKKGEGLAEPLRQSGVLPPLAVQLIRVGEESGQLEQMLLKVADIFEEEVQRTIQRLLALLVPVITIGLGVVVAFIVGSMLTAILSSYNLPL